MYIYLIIALCLLWQPASAVLSVEPGSSRLLRNADTTVTFTAINDAAGPFTWNATLSFTDFSGATGGACSPSGSADCSDVQCSLVSGTTFSCQCVYNFASLSAGDACLVLVANISDGTTFTVGSTQIGVVVNASLAVDAALPALVVSEIAQSTVTVTVTGSGLPSFQSEFTNGNATITLTSTPAVSGAACNSTPIEVTSVNVQDPGAALAVSFDRARLQDSCNVNFNVGRFGASASGSAVAIASRAQLDATPSRGIRIDSAAQQINITGSGLPVYAAELDNTASITFSWAAPCDALQAPTCASLTSYSGGLSCNGAVISEPGAALCVLQASLQRYGVVSPATSVGVAVTPLNIAASSSVLVIGVPQTLYLNFSTTVTLSSSDQAATSILFTSTGTSCTWSSGAIVPSFTADGKVNVTIAVGADQPASCSITALFSLYGVAGSASVIGTTALPQAPAAAPVAVATPVAAPVGAAPIGAAPIGAAPSAVRNATNSIYLTISGRSFPTDSHIDQIVGALADILGLDVTELDGQALAAVKRANFNYTVQIFFLSDRAVQVRGLVVSNTTLQSSLVDAITTATSGLYSGVSFADSMAPAPVAQPFAPQAADVTPVAAPSVELVGGIPGGAIAGGVIAAVVGVIIIICVVYGIIRAKKAKKQKKATEAADADGSADHHPKQRMDQTLLADKGAMVEMEAMQRARMMSRQKDQEDDSDSSSDSSKSRSHTKLDSEDQEEPAEKKKKAKGKEKAKAVVEKSQSESEEYSAPPESSSEEASSASSASSKPAKSSSSSSSSSSSASEPSESISSSKDDSESSFSEDTPKKKLTQGNNKKKSESSSDSSSDYSSSSAR
eukprot:TRINITY_DN2031_c0_g1_i2.p1 TRINITY_DN2031_c0_g1~~TRINITY_DN2031_c0_g1_i2.p1  ORF type:complete len:847 (-),score=205.17 TRINITY_DN2031_c0_g1_i2:259-2799(-)